MGVRIISDSRTAGFAMPVTTHAGHRSLNKVVARVARRPNQTPTLEVHHDNKVTKFGCPDALDANVAWIDPSCLQRSGTNLGVTVSYLGAGNCVLAGCLLPSQLAYDVFDAAAGAAIVAGATQWKEIATVAPNVPVQLEFALYTLIRATFSAHAATLVLTSR